MASFSALPDAPAQLLSTGFQTLSKNLNPADFVLLPLVVLGSAFVINRGSILPRSDPYYYKWFERPQDALGARAQVKARTRNIAELVEESSADIVVFWGSQSGTAEGFAHRLSREAHQRFKLKPVVADLQDYDSATIAKISASTLVVFIVSTFGEGDPSDNAQDFIFWLRDSKTRASMKQLKFAAFGCGNSNYRYYNKTVDEVTMAMEKFGATKLLPTGKGNEATRTTEEDFMEWKESLFATLVSQLGLSEVERGYEPLVDVVEDASLPADQLQLGPPFNKAPKKLAKGLDIVSVPVVSDRVLTNYPTQDRSCIEVTVDLTEHAQVKYKTGDHIAVWPENSSAEVNRLLAIVGVEQKRDTPIRINQKSDYDEVKVPALTTVDALFRFYLEICSPIPRETILALATMAPSASIKAALEQISHDRQTYALFLQNNYLTLARLLEYTLTIDASASWTSLPLSFVIDTLPTMQPRLYSIASSRITSPRHVALTVSVKPSELPGSPSTLIPGLSSTYLSTKKHAEADRLFVQIKASKFKLPVNVTIPLVMVAAGTGIAPFRAFLQERGRLSSVGREVGPMILFFGCQNEVDNLYKEELGELIAGPLAGKLEVVTAFSRANKKKVYVQDMVQKRRQDIVRLLKDEDAAFYICGAATMAKGVSQVLTEATMEINGWPESRANDWMVGRKKDNRWFEDVWS
ncbi:hypothetical protein B0T10DRAFT_410442 [Thelonectria olida]|uniref:NADPH--cytochrome P450 reductase n=1 Tax=Thelonectria olida TaxID=1576542 RepID=A0A9P8W034_9HYPO|nr:hypothetical protein B0T10DRAFT_410442 [Thelonectria olida]